MTDLLYWITNPLDWDDQQVLHRIEAGTQVFGKDRLLVAYLIARGCVRANLKRCTLRLTAKGRDACRFYAPQRLPAGTHSDRGE